VLCGDITQISADDLPAWILQNLLQDLILGLPDGGLLTGTVVVTSTGGVVFVPGPAAPAATAPGAPTNVSASPTGTSGSASVSFTPPASNGGSPITSYTATATPSGGGGGGLGALVVPVPVSNTGSGSPIVVTGLVDGESYTFTVTATNAIGTSAASAPSGTIAIFGPPTVDGQVVDIQAIGTGACVGPGEALGPANEVVSQDECSEVTFMLRVTNPGAPSFWIVFTELPDGSFGEIRFGGVGVDTVTQYDPSTAVFRFVPVQTEPSCEASPTFANCFDNYPTTVTEGPVTGSVQWSDTFAFRAENSAGTTADGSATLTAVDDICTSGNEGPRPGLPNDETNTIVDCPSEIA